WRPGTARETSRCSAGRLGVVVLDELGFLRALPELLGCGGRARGGQSQLLFQGEQLLGRVGAALPRLEPLQGLAARYVLVALGPRRVHLHGRLRVLVVPQQRLLRQVVAPLLHRQHPALLPVLGALLLLLDLGREPLLVRDGARHLLLGLRQLTPHVHDQLVQHLLRVLRARDQVADVRPDQRGETVKDPHGAPRRAGGSSLTRAQLALAPPAPRPPLRGTATARPGPRARPPPRGQSAAPPG